MTVEIAILEGDSIGPEIIHSTKRVINKCQEITDLDLTFSAYPVGWEAYEEYGTTLPEHVLTELSNFDGWLLGPVDIGDYPADNKLEGNPSGELRTHFDLTSNIRPVRSYSGVSPYPGVDITLFRQNSEGFYADRNMVKGDGRFMPTKDVALSMRVITRNECRRIAENAFDYADRNGYSVSAVHKANVLQHAGKLFLEECNTVAAAYPDVDFDDYHVDAFAMELVQNPQSHDVIVTTNMFGDILSDLSAGLVGSLGLAPGLNAGEDQAMAQAAHGSAPDIAGRGIANPTAEILSAKMLLEWLGEEKGYRPGIESARIIEDAVTRTIESGDHLTPDLGGNSTTKEFTDATIDALSA